MPISFPYDLCYTKLFEAAYLRNYPGSVPSHEISGGKGLKTSFKMMVSLAEIKQCVRRLGGVILTRFSTTLIPIHIFEDGSVQWHLIIHES